jgi:WD repeat-containing protein 35
VAASNLRDELDEVITLNSVSIIVAEFIPFGANQLVQMNANLGSTERVQGGFFTALIDTDSTGTKFTVDPGLTSVNILDYTMTKHVNFEAEIRIPEESGIIQVEAFGVSINADGTMFYGMQVEAIMDRIKDNVSLDTLSRLLVDVAIDSSTIVDSVLSAYQRKLMALIFDGDAANRDKVNLIIANEITPHLTAEEYMDKGEYENELKQVIGDTRAAFDVSDHETLVFGSSGLLIAGPNARAHEPLLCSYLQFTAMDLFIRNFFNRMFLVNDAMKQLRDLVNTYYDDPLSMGQIYDKMQVLSDDIRMLGEMLGYLAESLESCEIPPEPADASGRALYARLQIADFAGQLSMRVLDLKKTMEGVRLELGVRALRALRAGNGVAGSAAAARLHVPLALWLYALLRARTCNVCMIVMRY